MPSLTVWSERDFDIDTLEKYCNSTRNAVHILLELWVTNATSSSSLAGIIERSTNEHDDETLLNNFLEDKVAERVAQSLLQYGKAGGNLETAHVKTLRRALHDHEQKLPKALSELRGASERLSTVSTDLAEARKSKSEADQALLSAIMSKSELEKRFTPSALGNGSALPASAVNIMKKCDDRIKTAQASQLSSGERVTELRELLEEVTAESSQSRKDNLQVIENVEKKKLNSISATSNEILTLNSLLCSYLQRETEGIIEGPGAANQSAVSSAYSAQSVEGLDWVDRILQIDASERNLFRLQHLAEEVAAHESEDELKIADLEMEVEKIKAQIFQLQNGKGAFADRLAADYSNLKDVVKQAGVEVVRVIPQFSLPLPLKLDCYSPSFWRGFAIEEVHAEIAKAVDLPLPSLPDSEWNVIAYEQVLLGYFEITTRYPHILSPSGWSKLKSVVHTCRLTLKIPTKIHEGILELLLPDSVAVQDEIPPLDLRFRLCRLLVTKPVNHEKPDGGIYHQWYLRQVALIELAVRCLSKEDASGVVASTMVPLSTMLATNAMHGEMFDSELGTELLEHLTTFCEEQGESPTLSTPRGVLHQLISRIWKFAINLEEESGLHADVQPIAAFLHNFLTNRQYPYHAVWLGLALWQKILAAMPTVPPTLAKCVCEIVRPGDKWLEKLCGDTFWFGRGGVNNSSICASPISKTSSVSRASFADKNAEGGLNESTSRIVGFDLAYLNILTVEARDSVVAALCDYRAKLEPESLEIGVEIFKHLMTRSNTLVPLYMLPADSDYEQFLCGMCEFFVSESARSVCNRLIDPARFLDSISVARAHANDEARGSWISQVTSAIWKVCFELICEMDLYAVAWTRHALTHKHRLIWSKGLQSRIRAVVELINRDDDLWMTDTLPPGGQDLLAVLQVWERVSGDGGLTDIIRPKITRSLLKHLDRVETDSLPGCLHKNAAALGVCWAATRPPTILHSTNCVDLWTTIFTALQACIDAASAQLSMGTCSQMVVRCVERYCDNAKEGFLADCGYTHPLSVKAKRCFNRLVKSVDDETELPDVFKHKKKRKARLFKNDRHSSTAAAASGGEESDGGKVNTSLTQSSSEGGNLIGDSHLLLSDYFVLTSRQGSHDPTALMVRLHDFAFSLGEISKVQETLTEAIEKEHARLARLFKSQQKFENNEVSVLAKLPKESVAAMHESIEAGVADASSIVCSSASLVATYLALNLVFVDLREELFERLYMPTTRECSLAKILHRFESDKLTAFCQLTPLKWRTDVCRSVILHFVSSWVYVVADMAARGRVFKEFDSSVMNTDLSALHELAEQLGLQNDPQTQDILRAVGCLPVYVSGSTPAEFKANCERALADPTEKSKAKRLAKKDPVVVPPTAVSSYGRKPPK